MSMLVNPSRFASAALVWTSASFPALTESENQSNITIRNSIPVSTLGRTGGHVRLTFMAGSAGLNLGAAYVGLRSSSSSSFTAAPTQVLFAGVGTASLAAHATIVSDPIALAVASTDLLVSFYCVSGAIAAKTTAPYGNTFKSGVNDAATQTGSGYTSNGFILFVDNIEVAD